MAIFKIMYCGKETHVQLNGKWIMRLAMQFVFWVIFGVASAGLKFFHSDLPSIVAGVKLQIMQTELLSKTAVAKTREQAEEKVALCQAQNKQLVSMMDKEIIERARRGDNIGGEEPAETQITK